MKKPHVDRDAMEIALVNRVSMNPRSYDFVSFLEISSEEICNPPQKELIAIYYSKLELRTRLKLLHFLFSRKG